MYARGHRILVSGAQPATLRVKAKDPGLHERNACGIIFFVVAEPLYGSVISLLDCEHLREGVLINGQM
jgi:hypothetical protein